MNQKIPITIISGFLGAGKTTLLSNLLKHCNSVRIALLINEFGQVSIDGTLMSNQSSNDIEIHNLPNALVAYSEDKLFIPTLLAIRDQKQSVDQILIETSGLAAPSAVMELLSSDKQIKETFQLDASLVVVDTPLFLAGQFEDSHTNPYGNAQKAMSSLFQQQLANADIVVLNKIDSLTEDNLIDVESKIRHMAPSIRFVEPAYHAQLNPSVALGLKLHETTSSAFSHQHANQLATVGARAPSNETNFDGHEHSGFSAHTHGLHTHKHIHEHDPRWLSFALHCHQAQDGLSLSSTLEEIAQTQPVLRIKGFANITDGSKVLIQGVRDRITTTKYNGATVENTSQDHHAPSEDTSELVFIGYDLDRKVLSKSLSESTKTNWH